MGTLRGAAGYPGRHGPVRPRRADRSTLSNMRQKVVLDADDPRLPALLERQRRRRARKRAGRIVTAVGALWFGVPMVWGWMDPPSIVGIFGLPGLPVLFVGILLWGW